MMSKLSNDVIDLVDFSGSLYVKSFDEWIYYCCNSLQGRYDDVNNFHEIVRGTIEMIYDQNDYSD